MQKAIFILREDLLDSDYPPELREEMKQHVELLEPALTAKNYTDHWDLIEQADIIFAGMGSVEMNQAFMDKAPNLKAVFYAAGTMKYMLTDQAVWDREIVISTANAINAIPVAEFTLAQILLSLKNSWALQRELLDSKEFVHGIYHPIAGIFDTNVGIISLGAIGRLVVEHLKNFSVNILVYDPFISDEEAGELGVQLVSLEEIFTESDVVSLHSPRLPETLGMITGDHIASMKKYASFINTARGDIVKEEEMLAVLKDRPDLTALLDVTSPEPPAKDSALYTLDNVFLTPHIAGSVGKERQRQGIEMFEEMKRYLAGEPLKHLVTKEAFDKMA